MTTSAPPPAQSPNTAGADRGSLLVLFLTVFIDLLGFGMVVPLLPIYAQQFTSDQSGWLIGALMASFSLMQFLVSPLWGRLSDRIGRRPVLMIGLLGSVVFYTMFGLATVYKNIALLFVSRIGAGIAGATISTAQAYIADSTTLEERPRGMALIGMAFGLGFTFGPLFGFLAVPSGNGDPGPWPGYAAAILSGAALILAIFVLKEPRRSADRLAPRSWINLAALRNAMTTPSIGPLLLAIFVCLFSFSTFEMTLSMLIKKHPGGTSIFNFDWGQVCLTYASIGLTLAVVQGGVVRRLAGRVPEGTMAAVGSLLEVVGFGLIIGAIHTVSVGLLFAALAVVVGGFSMMQPSLNSLLSRRSDPRSQGGILGVGQSISSLARIAGGFFGVPLLMTNNMLPSMVAAALMCGGVLLVLFAARAGGDFGATAADAELRISPGQFGANPDG